MTREEVNKMIDEIEDLDVSDLGKMGIITAILAIIRKYTDNIV